MKGDNVRKKEGWQTFLLPINAHNDPVKANFAENVNEDKSVAIVKGEENKTSNNLETSILV